MNVDLLVNFKIMDVNLLVYVFEDKL